MEAFYHLGIIFNSKRPALYMLGILAITNIQIRGQLVGDNFARLFASSPDRLTTIDKPPYYAGKGRFFFLAVMGGLNVNTRLQALDKDWEVIPGLYLAGNIMGNRFAVDYPTMVPGICNGMALHFGRVAGMNAATLEP